MPTVGLSRIPVSSDPQGNAYVLLEIVQVVTLLWLWQYEPKNVESDSLMECCPLTDLCWSSIAPLPQESWLSWTLFCQLEFSPSALLVSSETLLNVLF
jgi:hypothetical protein